MKILHVAGKDNVAADALSRRSDYFAALESTLGASAGPQPAQLLALETSEEQPTGTMRQLIPRSTTSAEWQQAQETDAGLGGARQAAL